MIFHKCFDNFKHDEAKTKLLLHAHNKPARVHFMAVTGELASVAVSHMLTLAQPEEARSVPLTAPWRRSYLLQVTGSGLRRNVPSLLSEGATSQMETHGSSHDVIQSEQQHSYTSDRPFQNKAARSVTSGTERGFYYL